MFTDLSDRSLSAAAPACSPASCVPAPEDHARLMAAARARARTLRSQAIRDFGTQTWADFWRGADAVWQRMQPGQAAGQAPIRSATRLQNRLARHRALRGADATEA